MDMVKLKYFSVVAETGSMRKAAELLQISPPALSRAISRLEEELGKSLFTHEGRGLAITDQGRLFHQRAIRILEEYQSFLSDVHRRDEEEEVLRIGSFEIFSTHVLGWIVERDLAGRRLLVQELVPSELERALLDREIDFGITYLPVPHEALDFLKVATQELRVYGRADRFAGVPFAELPFCVPTAPASGADLSVQGLDGWPITGPARRIRFRVAQLETALNLAARGQGVLLCPSFVIDRYNELVREQYRLDRLANPRGMKPIKMGIFLAQRRATVPNVDVKLLMKALRRCCG